MIERRPLPLTDEDFSAMRASVVARIGKRRRAQRIGASAGLAFAMLALAFVLVQRPAATGPAATSPIATHPQSVNSAPRVGQAVGVPRATMAGGPPAATHLEVHQAAQADAAPRKPRRRHVTKEHHESIEQTASAEPMTIELHTSDPNIRIIWIAR